MYLIFSFLYFFSTNSLLKPETLKFQVMNIIELAAIIQDVDFTIQYLRDNNLLKKSLKHCGHECYQIRHRKTSDNWIFRCRKCRRKFSIRKDSILSKSKLTLQHLLLLIYSFANGFSVSHAGTLLKCAVSQRTIIQWYSYLREICSLSLSNTPVYLGENGSVVQIDEANIGAKRKYNRGYNRGIQQCIFGMLDVTTKKCVLKLVENRKSETLIPIITQHCVPNCKIHSDEAPMYAPLNEMGFVHRTVCHTDNFVSPNGVHTNNIESFWGHLKRHFRSMNGTNYWMLSLHVDEYMYRQNNKFNGELYDILLRDIATFYPV